MNAKTKTERLPAGDTIEANLPAITPMQMLQVAVQQGADIDKLQKLMELQHRWDAAEARKAFVRAMSEFKSDPPTVVKNKTVAYNNTKYSHATHDQVTNIIAAALSRRDLSHRWEVQQQDARITVTCIITHVMGHSEQVTMTSGADKSGQKNDIQAIASAVTYLQRYTLLSVTGLSTSDMPDDDGDGGRTPITDQQAADLSALANEVGAKMDGFLKYLKVSRLTDLPVSRFTEAVAALESKRSTI